MSEGMTDDDWKKALKKAEAGANRSLNPHEINELKRKFEAKQKQDLSKLQREITVKSMEQDHKKLREEMAKKGISSADQNMKTEQMIQDKQRQEAAQKAVGGTEQGPQTVS